jgi:hypothetical protein
MSSYVLTLCIRGGDEGIKEGREREWKLKRKAKEEGKKRDRCLGKKK